MRRRAPKRRRPAGKGSTFRMAKAALKGVKKLKRNTETKFVDLSASGNLSLMTASTTPFWLSSVAAGTTGTTRIGNVINPTSLFVRYNIRRAIGSSNTVDDIRVVIFRDRETDGVLPFQSNVFTNVTYYSPLNRIVAPRFKVMYDKIHRLTLLGPGAVTKKKYFKLSGRTTFGGVTADISEANDGHYMMYMLTPTTSSFPHIDFTVRFNFKDP